jgi:hypothetical protein
VEEPGEQPTVHQEKARLLKKMERDARKPKATGAADTTPKPQSYTVGMKVRHFAHGEGTVTEVLADGKVDVQFVSSEPGHPRRLVPDEYLNSLAFTEGMKVRHSGYGNGVVTSVEPEKCIVDFGDGRTKKILNHFLDRR